MSLSNVICVGQGLWKQLILESEITPAGNHVQVSPGTEFRLIFDSIFSFFYIQLTEKCYPLMPVWIFYI